MCTDEGCKGKDDERYEATTRSRAQQKYMEKLRINISIDILFSSIRNILRGLILVSRGGHFLFCSVTRVASLPEHLCHVSSDKGSWCVSNTARLEWSPLWACCALSISNSKFSKSGSSSSHQAGQLH